MKIFKLFKHNKEYINKYICDYDTLIEKVNEESENIDDINEQIDVLNKNIIILKALVESLYAKSLNLNNK